jgi:hypothetical protein
MAVGVRSREKLRRGKSTQLTPREKINSRGTRWQRRTVGGRVLARHAEGVRQPPPLVASDTRFRFEGVTLGKENLSGAAAVPHTCHKRPRIGRRSHAGSSLAKPGNPHGCWRYWSLGVERRRPGHGFASRRSPVRARQTARPEISPEIRSLSSLPESRKNPVSGAFPVAGAGFEPATSGL